MMKKINIKNKYKINFYVSNDGITYNTISTKSKNMT
jgi:hypothetical protein